MTIIGKLGNLFSRQPGREIEFFNPAFGLGNVKPVLADEPVDPLDDIENLIGDAVRYSRDGQGASRRSAVTVRPR